MFADADWEVEDKLPKLTNAIAKKFVQVKFLKALSEFNANSNGKISYSILNLMSSLIKFVDKVMKMKTSSKIVSSIN